MAASRFDDFDAMYEPFKSHRTLKQSKFLSVYRETTKPPPFDKVLEAVKNAAPMSAKSFEGAPGDVGEKAIILWSSNEVYKQLQQALISDDEDELRLWIWLVRAMNYYITDPAHCLKKKLVTFRGSKMKREVFETILPGVILRVPYYLASSPDSKLAEGFKETYMIKFHIPAGSFNAAPIKHLNVFGEDEVLIPPYTPIQCIGKTADQIEYRVLDGKLFEAEVEKKDIQAVNTCFIKQHFPDADAHTSCVEGKHAPAVSAAEIQMMPGHDACNIM